MSKRLFLRIVDKLETSVPHFQKSRDALGFLGLSTLQKVTAVVRLLAYDVSSDVVDEYLRVSVTSATTYLKQFYRAIYDLYSPQYLRDQLRKMSLGSQLRMLKGTFLKCSGVSTACIGSGKIVLAHGPDNIKVATKNAFNHITSYCVEEPMDLACLLRSTGMQQRHQRVGAIKYIHEYYKGRIYESTPVCFQVNRHEYNMSYYLADGIYPSWATFVISIPRSISAKHRTFEQYQEVVRKDVEMAFDVLQARWHIIRGSACMRDPIYLGYIMKACIILHNMIVEDEGEVVAQDADFPSRDDESVEPIQPSGDPNDDFNVFLARRVGI